MAYTRTQLNSTLAIISARHNELYPHLAVNNCICISQLNSISSRTWLNRLISNLNTLTPPICLEKGAYRDCKAAPANRTENCRHVYCLWQSAIQVDTPTGGTSAYSTPIPSLLLLTPPASPPSPCLQFAGTVVISAPSRLANISK